MPGVSFTGASPTGVSSTGAPSAPSAKGALLVTAVKDVRDLLDRGVLTPALLRRWLLPEDLPLIEEGVLASAWYDVHTLERVSLLLRDTVGGGSDDYLRELGRRSAEELFATGRYPQLSYARRAEVQAVADEQERFEAFGRDLRIMTSLRGNLFNFSRWSAYPEPGQRRYRVEVSEAAAFPDAVFWRMAGFVNVVAGLHGDPRLWFGERVRPDLIVFRMTRDI